MAINRNFNNEIWKPIPGFDKYRIHSKTLNIYSIKNSYRMRYQVSPVGKTFVRLKANDGIWKEYTLKSVCSLIKNIYEEEFKLKYNISSKKTSTLDTANPSW